MLIPDFLRALEQVVPLSAAGYERDAIGLQVGLAADAEISGVLCAFELTEDVIAEALERGANLIVAFHPLIFPSVAAVTDATRTGLLIRGLIKNDIALYVQHTAFDTHPEFGTSQLMAAALRLNNIRCLRTLPGADGFGMGAVGELAERINRNALLKLAARTFATPVLRHNTGGPETITTIAVLGGAGMDYFPDACASGADAFITADIRYHDFYRADHDSVLLIDAGHAETERFVASGMASACERALKLLQKQEDFPAPRLFAARTEPNSVRYWR